MNTRGRKPKQVNLEEKLKTEVESFIKTKEVRIPIEKPLTSREYIAGQALAGILSRSQGRVDMAEIKRECYSWADYFLQD